MGEISILDLQNLRHLIGGYATTSGGDSLAGTGSEIRDRLGRFATIGD